MCPEKTHSLAYERASECALTGVWGQSTLEFKIGAEPDLAFTLSQQTILKGSNHATMSEVRASDIGVGAAPNRVIPHVFKF